MQKVLRSSQKIHDFIKFLEKKVTTENSYSVHPDDEERGHEIQGEKPLWYPQNSNDCIPCDIEDCDCDIPYYKFYRTVCVKLKNLSNIGVDVEDVTIIIDEEEPICADAKKTITKFIQEATNIMRVKWNSEFEVYMLLYVSIHVYIC